MSGWGEYALAFAAFFLSHAVPVRPRIRARLVAGLGPRGFGVAYSILSLAVLAWLIGAAGRAPFVPLWDRAPWQGAVPLAAMAAVCVLLALSIGRPNPFSFGGARNDRFDPARPGIVRLTRHPLLVALAVWALAHLPPNGDLAHVAMFGAFGIFALAGRHLIDRRKRRAMGHAWTGLRDETARAPVLASLARTPGIAARLALALVLYGVLLWAHPVLFGVDPLG